jgi:hypothetical protein
MLDMKKMFELCFGVRNLKDEESQVNLAHFGIRVSHDVLYFCTNTITDLKRFLGRLGKWRHFEAEYFRLNVSHFNKTSTHNCCKNSSWYHIPCPVTKSLLFQIRYSCHNARIYFATACEELSSPFSSTVSAIGGVSTPASFPSVKAAAEVC